MAFNRDRNRRPGGPARYASQSDAGGGFRPRFNDRGPVEMHKAICDNCGKECEVPFRPTSGKPVYCSNCFENQRGGSDSRRPERRNQDKFAELNAKLDNILKLLENQKPSKKTKLEETTSVKEE